jgi:acyl-coenzyme A synthetase/AMP-(fatty) acid ligase
MAPWLCFAAFLNLSSIALYYGSPMSKSFCTFVSRAQVDVLGIIPSITKQLRASNLLDHIDWSHISRYSSTGEASNPVDQLWLMSRRRGYAPVVEYCGGTEIGGGVSIEQYILFSISLTCRLVPLRYCSSTSISIVVQHIELWTRCSSIE